MGAWGSGFLDNDGAADFVAELRKARVAERVDLLWNAFEESQAAEKQRERGVAISTVSADELEQLIASRESTLAANVHSPIPVTQFMPELATAETWEAYARALAAPRIPDAIDEATRALAAAWLLAARLGLLTETVARNPLDRSADAALAPLASTAAMTLAGIRTNPLWRESWLPHADAIDDAVHALQRALSAP